MVEAVVICKSIGSTLFVGMFCQSGLRSDRWGVRYA